MRELFRTRSFCAAVCPSRGVSVGKGRYMERVELVVRPSRALFLVFVDHVPRGGLLFVRTG